MESSGMSSGQQARYLTEFLATLQGSELDVSKLAESEWNDENWNRYRMKELVSDVVIQAGSAALQQIADEITEEKFADEEAEVLEPQPEILESKMLTEKRGNFKQVVTGAVMLARDTGILNDISNEEAVFMSCTAVDSVGTLYQVATGELSFSEGMSMIQNLAISTLGTMFGEAVSALAGAVAAEIIKNPNVFEPVRKFVSVTFGQKIGNAMIDVTRKVTNVVKQGVNQLKQRAGNFLERLLFS